MKKTPWLHEGSANYMGLLEYSRHVNSLRDMRRQLFRYKGPKFYKLPLFITKTKTSLHIKMGGGWHTILVLGLSLS